MTAYELWYSTDKGRRIERLYDVFGFELVKTIGVPGYATLSCPTVESLARSSIAPDRRVLFYRQPYGSPMALELMVMLRNFAFGTDANGLTTTKLSGVSLDDLLNRRIVAFYAGSAQSEMTGTVDDLMKAIVDDQLGAGSTTDYDGNSITTRDIRSLGLTIDTAISAADSITKGFSWQNLYKVLQGLQATSKSLGNEVFFGITPVTETTFRFRTWTGQPGRDLTKGTGYSMVFSLERGNLVNPQMVYDYSDEANIVYGGAQGNETERALVEVSDDARAGVSAFNRRERFINASRAETEAEATSIANDELAKRRPTRVFTGTVLSTTATPYGGLRGWNMGDRVTVQYRGVEFSTLIRSVSVKVDANGKESITARVEDTG